jgi:hypothetical protein
MAFSSPCRHPEAGRQPRPAPGRDEEIRELLTLALMKVEGEAMPPRRKDRPAPPLRRPAKPTPEERARAVIAKAEVAPGDKVWLTFRVPLPRPVAEALVARAIREERNIGTLVTEILEADYSKRT